MTPAGITREQWKVMGVLSLFWATLFGALGIFFPFYSLYLKDSLSLSGQQIGLAMGVFHLVGLVGQPSWGYLADRTGARKRPCWLSSRSGWLLASLRFGTSGVTPRCCWSRCSSRRFTPASFRRAWPLALGFCTGPATRTSSGCGRLGRSASSSPALAFHFSSMLSDPGPDEGDLGLLFPCSAAIILLTTAVVFLIPNQKVIREQAQPGAWRLLIADRKFLRFLLYVFLVNFMLDGPMFLFPVFVKKIAPENTLGTLKWLWLIMLVPEIIAIALAGHIRRRIGVRLLMLLGLAAGGVKWLACGFLGDLPAVLHASMLLHSVYVVGVLVAMPLCVNYLVPTQLRSTGQGLATMVQFQPGRWHLLDVCCRLADRSLRQCGDAANVRWHWRHAVAPCRPLPRAQDHPEEGRLIITPRVGDPTQQACCKSAVRGG